MAAYANVRGAISIPELLMDDKKAKNVFSEYDKLLGSAVNENAALYPIYVGLKEFVKTPKMTQSKAYANLANEYASKLDKIFNGDEKTLDRRDLETFSETRAYLTAFRSLTGNTDKTVNNLDTNIIEATYMEGLQELLHKRIAERGYCGYYCREKARSRTPGASLKKNYKCLCLFDASAIVSVKTINETMFEDAYDKLRCKKYAGSIKGVKDAVYEDILAFYDDYYNKKFDFEFSAAILCVNGKTLTVPKLVVKMTRPEALDKNSVNKIVKERILKLLQSRRDVTPKSAVTSKITPVRNAALNAALFIVSDCSETKVVF